MASKKAKGIRLRTSAKAIVIEGGRLLTIRKRGEDGDYHVAPGGTQKPGEALHETLVREVREETGALVEPGPLIHVRDYIGRNHELADLQPDVHDIDFYFRCRLLEPLGSEEPTETDKRQVGVEWVPLSELEAADFYPHALIPILQGKIPNSLVYLGDVN